MGPRNGSIGVASVGKSLPRYSSEVTIKILKRSDNYVIAVNRLVNMGDFT